MGVDELKGEIVDFYESLFKGEVEWRPNLEGLGFIHIEGDEGE